MNRQNDEKTLPSPDTLARELDALDALARDWHRDAQASERLTRNVREAICSHRTYVLPRFLVPSLASLFLVSMLVAGIGISVLRPPSALASVQQAMRQVRTARWSHETITRTVPGGAVVRTERGTTTVDLPRLAARVETGTNEVYIRTRLGVYWKRDGKMIPDDRRVTTEELTNDLRRRLLPEVRMQGREADWRVSEEVQEGRRVHHFALAASPDAPFSGNGNTTDEFWADSSTNRIVGTRYCVFRQEGKNHVEDVFTTGNYRYDLSVPESTFAPQ